ncbi:hypothetical protein [Flavobacterium sp. DG2-3]|uniref:hypothetical protein n=1 Tax=Flavobacterium sp. DG2-3 TaxID=3068317 RepID=UPI00273FA861|nr:hypothetical protein [Flavobacterium sp. DG2-3]MDP5201131.1 hypothetical protein [Flavobacterium sp. DG2-3]
MNPILERLKLLAKNEGITITKLELTIGASKGVLSRAIAHNSDIQSKWLLNLVENFPAYSCEWLIKGIEPMIRAEIDSLQNMPESDLAYKDLAESRKETIESLKKIIVLMEDKIAYSESEKV